MKSLNSEIKFLYLLIICSLFINILQVINIIPMIKILNTVIWFIIFVIGIFITHNDYNHFYNVKDKIQTLLIILISFFLIYFSIGLISGYSYNVYNNSSFNSILKNIGVYIIPLIFQEYIRGIFVNYSNNNKKIRFIISVIYVLINFSYNSLFSLNTGELIFKFFSMNLIPLIITEFTMTYLCSVGSYKLSMTYKVLFNLYIVLLPILPNLHFIINGFIFILLSVIIYFIIDSYHVKEVDKIYFEYKKSSIFSFIPIVVIFIIFIGNLFNIFKYNMVAVMSDSMNPLYYRGDSVVLKKLNNKEKEKLKKGDIIAYKDSSGNLIIHRINNIYKSIDEIVITAKGDNNSNVDNIKIKLKDIEGKYLFHIKFLGYPRVFISEMLSN